MSLQNLKLDPHLLTVPPNIGGVPTEQVEAKYGLTAAVEMGSNENSFGASPRALAALQPALQKAHRYPGSMDKRLREKLAAHYNVRHAAALTPENFLTGNGSSDVIRMLIQALVFDGGNVVFSNPTFPLYKIFTRQSGGEPLPVPHLDYRHDLDAMADALTPDTRIVFVCNPNNPTGTIVSRAQVEKFMARVPPSVVVAFDEAYYEYVDQRDYSNALEYVLAGHANVVVLKTFSKIYGLANMRVGYAIGTRPLIEYLAHAQLAFNTGDPNLAVAMAALEDQAFVEDVRHQVAAEKQFLYDGLTQLEIRFVPTQANFVLLVDLPRDVPAINEEMLRRGIIVRPMAGFGLPTALRVTIGTHAQNEKMLAALKDVLAQSSKAKS